MTGEVFFGASKARPVQATTLPLCSSVPLVNFHGSTLAEIPIGTSFQGAAAASQRPARASEPIKG
jgi:hypothetical protein